MTMDYKVNVEDKDYYWKVIMVNKKTGEPFTWVNVEKSEYPTRESAIEYLEDRYFKERNIFDSGIEKNPYRMMSESTERKKKTTKPKAKKKPVRKCRCK